MGIPIISEIVGAVKDLASELIVDPDKKKEINLKLKEIEDRANERLHEQMIAQVEVNKIEAASSSVFVAGYRPAIGWVGAAALAYAYIISPFLGIWVELPQTDFEGLFAIVMSMLGVGAMRSYEKVKGVATTDMTTKNK